VKKKKKKKKERENQINKFSAKKSIWQKATNITVLCVKGGIEKMTQSQCQWKSERVKTN
jgi:hypothetical protein